VVNEAAPPSPPEALAAIELAKRQDFALGTVTVRPSLRTVIGPAGSARGEPRVVQVLVALADARGQVLSRDDLLQLCWEGRIVGDDAINRAVAEVRRIVAEVGAPFEIETVSRVGYRIAGLVWAEEGMTGFAAERSTATSRRRFMLAGGGMAVLAATGTAAIVYRNRGVETDALIERGQVIQGSGGQDDEKRAEALFREAIARDPDRADAWGWLAVVLDDWSKAREAAQHAVSLDPREPNARSVLAFQRRDLEAWTQWEAALLDILSDAPECAQALAHLTFFYQSMGRCAASWSTNERAIAVEPFNPSHQHRRALKHWIFNRLDQADKAADQGLQLWPRNGGVWNTRIMLYAFTDRANAALAFLDDKARRPERLRAPSIESWRAGLTAIASRSTADVARAVEICTDKARLAPGLAANAIMILSHLGELDAAYRVAEGLFEKRGDLVQRPPQGSIRDIYSASSWGRTQFLFIPVTAPFRADSRFPDLCQRLGHVEYWKRRGIWPDPFVRGAIDPRLMT
jgi:DNA-binding winged helix-turn-helix (wHTH) protein/Tfp pilus assembly protein PilF